MLLNLALKLTDVFNLKEQMNLNPTDFLTTDFIR